ncbi:cell wall protein [Nocardiopsis sp. NPDC058631]|uniref:cell wall protein n=1 Tax=Nocardiopsis sp. NPDC058631 TaxID=3346566 RepID=UPI003662A656
MKNTRVTARRILQGGAAFAALGALGVATALPAAADTQTVGWAHANVSDGYGIAETYITPQGESDSASNSFSGALDEYFSIEASTSASVDGNGATSTTTVASASVQLTASDVEEIIEEAQDEEDDAELDDAELDEEPSDEPTEEGTETEEPSAPGEGEGEDEGTAGTPSEEPVEVPGTEPTEAPDADGGEAPADDAAVAPLVELGEDDIDLSSAGDEIVLSATITGASVTTTQSWDGAVTHSVDPGSVAYEVNELDAVVGTPYQDQGTYTSDDAGFDWDDAYTALLVDITVPGEFEGGYALGVTYASIGATAEDPGNGGGNDNDNGGDGGDDKTPPSRDTAELPKPEPKPTEALATTGSPLAGLIAAGAAIAAGGGAAAYFARRKKNAADTSAESSEG